MMEGTDHQDAKAVTVEPLQDGSKDESGSITVIDADASRIATRIPVKDGSHRNKEDDHSSKVTVWSNGRSIPASNKGTSEGIDEMVSSTTVDSSAEGRHISTSSGNSFENTLLDPKVDIKALKGSINDGYTSESKNNNVGNTINVYDATMRDDNAMRSSPSSPSDALKLRRANAINTIAKDPIVPHRETLKRIRTNYKLKELSEEDYVGCLETIIERDYFPDLVRLRMSNALMEAETRGDNETASIVRRHLEKYDREQEVNVQLKTVDNENVSINLGKGGLKLDEFSRIFTSEDNRNFARLLEQTIIRSNKSTSWMEEAEMKHNQALCNVQSKTNLGIKDKDVLSNRVVSRNALFFNPQDVTAPDKGNKISINSANTYMPSDHGIRMDELDHKQKMKRTEHVKSMHYNKVNELITQFGLRECKELLDDEQKAKYDFVHTPLTSAGHTQEYSVPLPVTREELADKLRKKYNTPSARTPMAKTPMCRTPLLVQKLIAKHKSGADLQLRKSYSSSKYSKSSTSAL